MAASDLFSWYEAGLPSHERKQRGHFSTPPQLIERLLDACGYTAEKDLLSLRVLDPACGSGNFLISATRRLMASGARVGLDDDTLATLVQRNIWGFDPDPVACFLAEVHLQTTFAQELEKIRSSARTLPASTSDEGQATHHKPICSQSKILHYPHIHQADGLAFPWEQYENVDLLLANPPYLASKNTDLSGYCPARQRGQADSYLLFLHLALQVVRPDGWIALVLPDPLLARASASIERQLLLSKTTVYHLWHLSKVFTASVGAVVVIAQKCPSSRSHYIHWERGTWQQSDTRRHSKKVASVMGKEELFADLISYGDKQMVSQDLLRSQPGAELRYLLSEVQGTLVARLHTYCYQSWQFDTLSSLVSLDAFVQIRRGEEISKVSSQLSERPEHSGEETWYPVLRGGVDIHPYCIKKSQCWISNKAIKKSIKRYSAPKILIVKSVGRLQAALDLHGHVVLQTLYILLLRQKRPLSDMIEEASDELSDAQRDEDDLYFLLALLNSRLLQQYVYILHTAYKWVQPQIEQHVLAHLPIPTLATAAQRKQIVQRARLLMDACEEPGPVVELNVQSQELYREQEQAICALYTAALEVRAAPMPIELRGSEDTISFYKEEI